tara:strand:+ start:508 stop:879 length:372 start_codon:yes stop_codon:yes gene_type:complete
MSMITVTNIKATGETASRVTEGVAAASLNYKGTSTNSIRYSFNVSSVTDNTTGDYTTNFTNNMSSADYTVTAANGGDTTCDNVRIPKNAGSLAASGFSCNTVITGASINDATYVFQTVHGDLA